MKTQRTVHSEQSTEERWHREDSTQLGRWWRWGMWTRSEGERERDRCERCEERTKREPKNAERTHNSLSTKYSSCVCCVVDCWLVGWKLRLLRGEREESGKNRKTSCSMREREAGEVFSPSRSSWAWTDLERPSLGLSVVPSANLYSFPLLLVTRILLTMKDSHNFLLVVSLWKKKLNPRNIGKCFLKSILFGQIVRWMKVEHESNKGNEESWLGVDTK